MDEANNSLFMYGEYFEIFFFPKNFKMLLYSIGSLGLNGRTDKVEEVQVRDCTFTGTQNGVRIKTWEVMNKTFTRSK